MATAEHSVDFAIESQADALLSHLSDELINLVLRVASESTTHRTPSGTRLVTRADIVKSALYLAEILKELEQREDFAREARQRFTALREKIESLRVEPADAR